MTGDSTSLNLGSVRGAQMPPSLYATGLGLTIVAFRASISGPPHHHANVAMLKKGLQAGLSYKA